MDEKTREALKIVSERTNPGLVGSRYELDGSEALAHLQAMAEENETIQPLVEMADGLTHLNMTLEAENERLKEGLEQAAIINQGIEVEKDALEADLARYRRYDKLIEAVEKLRPGDIFEYDCIVQASDDEGGQELLRAALSCREEK